MKLHKKILMHIKIKILVNKTRHLTSCGDTETKKVVVLHGSHKIGQFS